MPTGPYGAASGDFTEIDAHEAEQRQVTVVGIEDRITPEEWTRLTERALTELVEGRIRPVVGQTFPLERAADAHRDRGPRRHRKTLLLT